MNLIELKRNNFRVAILERLLQLSDFNYQKREWLSGDYWYASQFREICEFLIEECEQMEQALDKQKEEIAYKAVGLYLRTQEEAAFMYKLVNLLYKASQSIPQRAPNKYYLESPYLPPIISSAKATLNIFLKNEKDKNILAHIENYKEEKGLTN